MGTLLNLWSVLQRKLTTDEVDANFINLRATADGASPLAGPGSAQAFTVGTLTGGPSKFSFPLGAGTPTISANNVSADPVIEFQRWSGAASNFSGVRIKATSPNILTIETATTETTVGSQTFAERLRVTTSGNLLIGTPTDNGTGAKLQVLGALTATSTGTFTTGIALATTPFPWVSYRQAIDICTTGAIVGDSNSNTISVVNNAYVGVSNWTYKITGPGGLFQIANDGSFRTFTMVSGTAGTSATPVLQCTHSANGNLLLGTSADTIYIGAGRALNLVAPTGTARIAVAGATTADSASIDIGCGAQRSGVIQGNADGSLAFHSNATLGTSAAVERMRIVALSGNVLIGATIDNTFAKLQVTGNLTVTGYLGETLGGVVASAPTIAPTGAIFHVTGTTPIATISLPYTGFVGTITIIPDGIFTTTTAGNIALASTMVVGKANSMTYDGAKWYPSY